VTAKLTKSYIRRNVYKFVIMLAVSKRAIIINGCQIISVVFISRRGRRKLGRKWRWSGQI